jgi:light-regulated signal transduction histidine kinase (bacteriophytochrome)
MKRPIGEDGEVRGFGERIQEAVKRMEMLIRDLLAYSRTGQREETHPEPTDLSESLNEALAVLGNTIDETGAVITVEPLPTVLGDTTQLAHVFQNLLSNALKYQKKDLSPYINIRAQRRETCWVISVADNGVGFGQQCAERIFGLFKRLHGSEYPGTGLGLAICQRIVERYGGRIWAESSVGEGSTFYFELPGVGSNEGAGNSVS